MEIRQPVALLHDADPSALCVRVSRHVGKRFFEDPEDCGGPSGVGYRNLARQQGLCGDSRTSLEVPDVPFDRSQKAKIVQKRQSQLAGHAAGTTNELVDGRRRSPRDSSQARLVVVQLLREPPQVEANRNEILPELVVHPA